MKKTEQWERQFDKKIYKELMGYGWKPFVALVKDFIRSLLKQVRQESKTELTAQLEAIVERNTDKEFGTDYDGLAEGVLVWLAEQRKREK